MAVLRGNLLLKNAHVSETLTIKCQMKHTLMEFHVTAKLADYLTNKPIQDKNMFFIGEVIPQDKNVVPIISSIHKNNNATDKHTLSVEITGKLNQFIKQESGFNLIISEENHQFEIFLQTRKTTAYKKVLQNMLNQTVTAKCRLHLIKATGSYTLKTTNLKSGIYQIKPTMLKDKPQFINEGVQLIKQKFGNFEF